MALRTVRDVRIDLISISPHILLELPQRGIHTRFFTFAELHGLFRKPKIDQPVNLTALLAEFEAWYLRFQDHNLPTSKRTDTWRPKHFEKTWPSSSSPSPISCSLPITHWLAARITRHPES